MAGMRNDVVLTPLSRPFLVRRVEARRPPGMPPRRDARASEKARSCSRPRDTAVDADEALANDDRTSEGGESAFEEEEA